MRLNKCECDMDKSLNCDREIDKFNYLHVVEYIHIHMYVYDDECMNSSARHYVAKVIQCLFILPVCRYFLFFTHFILRYLSPQLAA